MNNISVIRERQCLTKTEVAIRLGVTVPRIVAIERAERLKDTTIRKVAKALGVTEAEIVVGPEAIETGERFLSIKEVASILNISYSQARILIRSSIPHMNIGVKNHQFIRVRKKDLEAYIEGSKQNG